MFLTSLPSKTCSGAKRLTNKTALNLSLTVKSLDGFLCLVFKKLNDWKSDFLQVAAASYSRQTDACKCWSLIGYKKQTSFTLFEISLDSTRNLHVNITIKKFAKKKNHMRIWIS